MMMIRCYNGLGMCNHLTRGSTSAPLWKYRGQKSCGRPRKTWKESIVDDLKRLNLIEDMAGDCLMWRSLLKAASHTHV